MAMDTRKSPTVGLPGHQPLSGLIPRLVRGFWRFVASAIARVGKCFAIHRAQAKRKTHPVHEEVTLNEEGYTIWNQVMDPNSPVGKPIGLHGRRLPSGD